jgi:aminoglycoside phosphotransferase (APT) family kinase protein
VTDVLDGLAERVRESVHSVLGSEVRAVEDLGGHSGLTLAAVLEDGTRVVVKLSPPGRAAVGRHDVLRQARLLRALAGVPGIRVPRILGALGGDPAVVVMEWVGGEAAEPVLDILDPHTTPADVEGRARDLARVLAALHGVSPEHLDMPEEPRVDVAAEVERWRAVMDAAPAELRPNAGELIALLRETAPAPSPAAVLHGDFRLGNALCRGGAVKAVIDWEIWSLGDPRVDLGWMLLFCDAADFPGAGHRAPGMPSAAELLRVYQDARGLEVEDMQWFLGLAAYKMSAIMGHNLRRHREGRRHDPYQETLPPTILHLGERALSLLRESRRPR